MEFEPFGHKPNVVFEVTIKWNGKKEKILVREERYQAQLRIYQVNENHTKYDKFNWGN